MLAAAVVRAARDRKLTLDLPEDVHEVPGHGVRGVVQGHDVAVGKASWASPSASARWVRGIRRRAALDGALTIFVQVDGAPVGALLLDDPIRPDATRTIRQLRRDGIRRIVMVTGDREDNAQTVGAVIGVDDVLAERTPAEKVDAVRLEKRAGPTIMVGDGINDAPALALADVGVAVGARGATASSEAADVVLTVDRLDRLGEAVVIARRARLIAYQSVVIGIGLSLAAMLIAALGYLPPAWGAILQEVIDVAVILNALRALRDTTSASRLTADEAEIARRFSAEHATLRPDLARIRKVADTTRRGAAGRVPGDGARDPSLPGRRARTARRSRGRDPVSRRSRAVLGGKDPTAMMSRAHVEIAHLIRRIGRVLDDLDPAGPDDDDITELRRLLYGLHAVLQLHFAQEDEGYLSLADETQPPSPPPKERRKWRPSEHPIMTVRLQAVHSGRSPRRHPKAAIHEAKSFASAISCRRIPLRPLRVRRRSSRMLGSSSAGCRFGIPG